MQRVGGTGDPEAPRRGAQRRESDHRHHDHRLRREPGVYSARYMGENTSYRIKNQIILDRLHGVPDIVRSARFVCVIAAAFPDGTIETRRATIEGRIAQEAAGENGFGYDPIFYLPDRGKTTAQLSAEEKNEISHRGKALRQIKEIL